MAVSEAFNHREKIMTMSEFLKEKTPDQNAFWNINVPTQTQTYDCPDFLLYCLGNEKDRDIISTPDSQFERLSWPQVKEIVSAGRPDLFQRVPSELRRYREFCVELNKQYEGVNAFILHERLKWNATAPSGHVPFSNGDDYKILFNDWPYGIDKRVWHLVVWTKFEMDEDTSGNLLPAFQKYTHDFVDRTFVDVCGAENVVWFRNWRRLKSVHAFEHIHVMIFNPDMSFLDRLTGGDWPLAFKLDHLM